MENAFHCQVLSGYGLTETSPVASFARPKSTVAYADDDDRHRYQAMAGWPLPGTEIRVVDADMRDVDMTGVELTGAKMPMPFAEAAQIPA